MRLQVPKGPEIGTAWGPRVPSRELESELCQTGTAGLRGASIGVVEYFYHADLSTGPSVGKQLLQASTASFGDGIVYIVTT